MSAVKQAEELVETVRRARTISEQYPLAYAGLDPIGSKNLRLMRLALQGNQHEMV